jgi:hypothetical protein
MTEKKNFWEDDRLGRAEDAARLYRLTFNRHLENSVYKKSGSFVVNVDARWGQGKTFLLSRMYQDVLQDKHPAVFINAWEHDFIDDPFTLCVAALDDYVRSIVAPMKAETGNRIKKTADNVRRNFGKIASVVMTDLAKTAATKMIGGGVTTVINLATEENGEARLIASDVGNDVAKSLADVSAAAIDDFAKSRIKDVNEAKQSVASFKEGLAELLAMIDKETDKRLPFYVFLDELDRCKPTYAIAMLERIKHLFDVAGVVFILATDTEQLSSSIKAVYGNNFDSMHYLQRFFHRSYQLPEANTYLIAYEQLTSRPITIEKWHLPPTDDPNVTYIAGFLANTASQFKLSPRQFEQSIDILHDVTTVWPYDFKIQLLMMYPLICVYARERKLDPNNESDFIRSVTKSDQWQAPDTNNNPVKFAPYYSAYKEMMAGEMYVWLMQKQRMNLSAEQAFVYQAARTEFDAVVKNIKREDYTSNIKKYGQIILSNRTQFFD